MFHSFSAVKLFAKVTALAAPALLLLPVQADASVIAAPSYYYPTYEVTSNYNITAIVTADRDGMSSGSYLVNSFSTFAATSQINDPFIQSAPTLYSHFTGVTDLIPGTSSVDLSADLHLVLAVNNIFAASLIDQEFTSIFPDFTESSLIAAMLELTNPDSTQTDHDNAISELFSFSDALYNAGGDFNLTLSEGFTLVAFSDGQLAGRGLSFPTPGAAPGAVPEPMTWLMMLGGFLVIGGTMRRSRRIAGRLAQAG